MSSLPYHEKKEKSRNVNVACHSSIFTGAELGCDKCFDGSRILPNFYENGKGGRRNRENCEQKDERSVMKDEEGKEKSVRVSPDFLWDHGHNLSQCRVTETVGEN